MANILKGLLIFLVTFSWSCQKPTTGSASLSSSDCKTPKDPVQPVPPNPTANIPKLDFNPEAVGRYQIKDWSFGVSSSPEVSETTILPEDKLVAIVDQLCVKKLIESKSTSESWLSQVLYKSPEFRNTNFQAYHWSPKAPIKTTELEEQLNQDPCIVTVSHDVIHHTLTTTPNDPSFSVQKHLTAINATSAYDVFYSSSKGINQTVVIAIIDDGFNMAHEDLTGGFWTNSGETAGNSIDDDGNGYADDIYGYNFASKKGDPEHEGDKSHGTHVAGLAAAQADNSKGGSGVMGKYVKIMALNVFGESTGASTTDIANAIYYAANNGANVINMSLGGLFSSSSLKSALQYAVDKNVVVLAAAGNDNVAISSSTFYSPVGYAKDLNGMLGVGSTDASTNTRSSFSNYSTAYVEIGAPGSDSSSTGLYSTVPGSTYGYKQGTSMASPVAAGAAALAYGLLKTRSGSASNAAVKSLIMSTGKTVSALTPYFKNGKLLDINALAVQIDSSCSQSN